MPSVSFNRFIYFVTVVDMGSFTAAADRLGVAKAVVSHQLSKLEEELGTALLIRTTRRLRATEAGRRFYERCIIVLREAENAIDEVSSETGTPAGTLMLTAPLDYGAKIVAPAVAIYLERYPQMKVDLKFTDVKFDLVDNELDLSIRVGWLEDSSAQARRIGTFEQHLVCSPAYAARMRSANHPEVLEDAKWIANGALKEPLRWLFSSADKTVTITGKPVVTANGTEASYVCVLAGIGLAVMPDYQVADDIAGGRLVQILPDWSLPSGGIHAVYPPAKFRPARVRAFVDILEAMERERRS
ncbi:LysR family transcriptional regulator [Phyllobacterium sp. OV277]|jgi:DNA-binding transcriptional LysR family regulator|uniref:LysR family transcriptional regulator n=1 Tax=Phyllobacterium sp. OV277 TaxID=1882772 RepID=UPI000880961F|nr:LysR family transcriptional regulator [Phyllobacterium sp. OV277]SDO58148.1 DNA-binding transcriptional regulator, LysR family [Phyllobacterium sp. OV277]